MHYEYTTATGPVAIEVDEQYYNLLDELDIEEKNSNRKHSRRHPISLNDVDFEGDWFADNTDILGELIRREDSERLWAAILELNPEQQELLRRVYSLEDKIVRLAEEQGVTEAAIRDRLKRIYRRLQKKLQ